MGEAQREPGVERTRRQLPNRSGFPGSGARRSAEDEVGDAVEIAPQPRHPAAPRQPSVEQVGPDAEQQNRDHHAVILAGTPHARRKP